MNNLGSFLLAITLVTGCKSKPEPPTIEKPPVSSAAPSASLAAAPDAGPPPLDLGPAPSASSASLREERVVALLTGQLEANRLREISTEPGETIDPKLRYLLRPLKGTPHVNFLEVTATGLLPDAVQRITRQNLARLRACYERGLSSNPYLQGRIKTTITVGDDGRVTAVDTKDSDIPDQATVECVSGVIKTLIFPTPEASKATAVIPIEFLPPDKK